MKTLSKERDPRTRPSPIEQRCADSCRLQPRDTRLSVGAVLYHQSYGEVVVIDMRPTGCVDVRRANEKGQHLEHPSRVKK